MKYYIMQAHTHLQKLYAFHHPEEQAPMLIQNDNFFQNEKKMALNAEGEAWNDVLKNLFGVVAEALTNPKIPLAACRQSTIFSK